MSDIFAKLLLEKAVSADPAIQTFIDRMLLRVYSSTSLQAWLLDVNTYEENGAVIVELDFRELPSEVIGEVKKLLVGNDVDVKVKAYLNKETQLKHHVFVVKIKPQPESGA